MQQGTTAKPPNHAANGNPMTRAAPSRNRFVINLCSSTSPVALTRPDHAGLKRFTFFVSRRREEGRERFRLHMGYFESQEEAERLLDIVREIYPGAWAGLAPGQRLRARQAAAEQAAASLASSAPAVPAHETAAGTSSAVSAASAPAASAAPAAPSAASAPAPAPASQRAAPVVRSADSTGETRIQPPP